MFPTGEFTDPVPGGTPDKRRRPPIDTFGACETTPMIESELEATARLALAALIGLGVGLEREWSGHTSGPDARFAGIRTFLLLGFAGGAAGICGAQGMGLVALAFALGGVALTVSAYIVATRRPGAGVDGTTEAAALSVLALAALAGMGWRMLAAGAGSVVVLALSEKTRLHALVRHVSETELHAALQFTVLAVVVLPLLPAGPLFGALAIRPRMLWTVVLLFSGLNFAGYLARRAVGLRRGIRNHRGAWRYHIVNGRDAEFLTAKCGRSGAWHSARDRGHRGVHRALAAGDGGERRARSKCGAFPRAIPAAAVRRRRGNRRARVAA